MKTKVVPMREYPQEIEETVQKINKCLNISLFDWQIGYIFTISHCQRKYLLLGVQGKHLQPL